MGKKVAKRGQGRLPNLDPPVGKYRVLYADPPWSYKNTGFAQSARKQYPCMELDEICALPIADLVDDRTVLFLWVTAPLLIPNAQEVIEAWGFEYKTFIDWRKNRAPGLGWFGNSKSELLLIATHGKGMHPKEKLDLFIEAKVRKHSQKPDEVYSMIEQMYDGPYIELFARSVREGWDLWGNEL